MLVNIDTGQVAHALYVDAPCSAQVCRAAASGRLQPGQHPLGGVLGLGRGVPRHWWDFPLELVGWLVTAFAVSYGAPFWFEALSRLGSLRTAGTRPASSTSSST